MNNFDILSKDILIELAIELDLPDIINWCRLNKRFDEFTCKSDVFWRRKFIHDYGDYSKVLGLSWREFYKYVTVTKPNDLLWKGVEKNVLSYVVVALKRGANINNIRILFTPLSKASKRGQLEIVKYLVEQGGADINFRNGQALGEASYDGQLEVVKYLVGQGMNDNAVVDQALMYASENGHLEVVKYLVENGADVRFADDYALRRASRNGHLEVVKYLVEHGADVHARDNYAVLYAIKEGHQDIVDYLKSLQ